MKQNPLSLSFFLLLLKSYIMQTFCQTVNGYKPYGIAIFNVKTNLDLLIMREPQLPNSECIIGRQEDPVVESSFCNVIISGPNKLFCILCDYISLKDFCYRPHPNTTKVIFGIAFFFPQTWIRNLL